MVYNLKIEDLYVICEFVINTKGKLQDDKIISLFYQKLMVALDTNPKKDLYSNNDCTDNDSTENEFYFDMESEDDEPSKTSKTTKTAKTAKTAKTTKKK